MSISGSISNTIISKESVVDFLKREMGKSYAVRQGDPMLLVNANVTGGPLIPIQVKKNLVEYDPSQVLQLNLPFSQATEMEYLAKLSTVRRGVDVIKKGMEGNPKDFQLLTFPLIQPMVGKPTLPANALRIAPAQTMQMPIGSGMYPMQPVMQPQVYNPNPVYQSMIPNYSAQPSGGVYPSFK